MAAVAVHWLEQTTADVPAAGDWLSAREADRLESIRLARRRADWLLGRWTAKQAVAACLHIQALGTIEIRAAPSGAPEVFLANEAAPVTISLSHRAGRAACAVAAPGTALGCDLEIIEPHSDAFIADYFTAEEQALVAQALPDDRSPLLALLWSAKESALKALGVGLRLDTRCVIVTPSEALRRGGSAWCPLQVHEVDGTVFHGWGQRADGLIRTLVAAPPPCRPVVLTALPASPPSAR